MAVWQSTNTVDPTWAKTLTPYQAACMFWFGAESDVIRLITDPATLRDCWHCGRVMEAGRVDEMGRDWCGCVEHLPTQVVSDGSIRVKEIQGVEVVSKLAEFPKTKGA